MRPCMSVVLSITTWARWGALSTLVVRTETVSANRMVVIARTETIFDLDILWTRITARLYRNVRAGWRSVNFSRGVTLNTARVNQSKALLNPVHLLLVFQICSPCLQNHVVWPIGRWRVVRIRKHMRL